MGDEARELKSLVEYFQLEQSADTPEVAVASETGTPAPNQEEQPKKAPEKEPELIPASEAINDFEEFSSPKEDDEWTRF